MNGLPLIRHEHLHHGRQIMVDYDFSFDFCLIPLPQVLVELLIVNRLFKTHGLKTCHMPSTWNGKVNVHGSWLRGLLL